MGQRFVRLNPVFFAQLLEYMPAGVSIAGSVATSDGTIGLLLADTDAAWPVVDPVSEVKAVFTASGNPPVTTLTFPPVTAAAP